MSEKIYKSFEEFFGNDYISESGRLVCNVTWNARNEEINHVKKISDGLLLENEKMLSEIKELQDKLDALKNHIGTYCCVDDINVDLNDFSKDELITVVKNISTQSWKLFGSIFPLDKSEKEEVKIEEDYDNYPINYQSWICPLCFDDHASDKKCKNT